MQLFGKIPDSFFGGDFEYHVEIVGISSSKANFHSGLRRPIQNQTATLFLGGTAVASNIFMPGGPPSSGWTFSGLVSDLAFDKVVITPIFPADAGVDDLWFPTIPAPPALAVAALAALGSRRRRTVS